MIALIRGVVASRAENHLVIDVQGVGYRVFVSPSVSLGLSTGSDIKLHIHTHVREDAFHLFGFPTEMERELFLSLQKVRGIGPKLAMTILGATTKEALVAAVSSGDVKRLTHIPGLGKKTAERILVELQETFKAILPSTQLAGGKDSEEARLWTDVVSALSNLGFKPAAIDAALQEVRDMPDKPADFDGLFREPMKRLR